MSLFLSILPFVLVILFQVVEADIRGIIVAGKRALESNQVVKSFLDDYEAEEYAGVNVKQVDGSERPTLTVYNGRKEVDQVDLGGVRSKSELHRMMMQYGFQFRDSKELHRMRERRRQKEHVEAWNRGEKDHLKKPDYLNHRSKELYEEGMEL